MYLNAGTLANNENSTDVKIFCNADTTSDDDRSGSGGDRILCVKNSKDTTNVDLLCNTNTTSSFNGARCSRS